MEKVLRYMLRDCTGQSILLQVREYQMHRSFFCLMQVILVMKRNEKLLAFY